MNRQIFIAGLLGGLAIFVWSSISWMALPWHSATISNLPAGEQIAQLLKESGSPSGVYHFPGFPAEENEAAMAETVKKFNAGPNLTFLVYHPGGLIMMDPMQFIRALIFNILAATLGAYLLSLSGPPASFGQRFRFVALLGVIVAVVGPLSDWNWWHFPMGFTLVNTVDMLLTWMIAGAVIAWRVTPQS